MNKIYSKVWSKSLGMMIVANEFARANGKGGHSRRIRHALAALPLGVLLALGAIPAAAAEAPASAPQSIDAAASGRATAAAWTLQQTAVGPAGPIADAYFAADGAADGSDDASANGARSVAGGAGSTADGEEATSYGAGSYAGDDFSTAIGGNATALGEGASAFGNSAATFGAYATALGASATADDDHSLALGAFSQASAAYAVALGAGSIADRANSVSLGSTGNERQITHLAAGTADTDAVNLAQLNLAIADVDGGAGNPLAMAYDDAGKATATLAGASGTVLTNVAAGEVSTTSTDAVNGSQLNSTNEAVAQNTGDIATHTTDIATLNQAIADVEGGTNPYFAADGAGDGSDDANALGASSTAAGASSTADGEEATSYGAGSYAGDDFSTAIGGNATAIGESSSAIGNSAATFGNYAAALGASATADDDHSLALGAFSQASAAYAVALGAGSIADRANSVSLGSTGNERQITHLAAGTADTDAVNLAQLNLAIADVDGGAGNPLAMAYDDAGKATATLAGASGTVLANVAAGEVSTTSTDAVNGSQLNSTNEAVAQNTGDIATHTTDIATLNQAIADVEGGTNPYFAADGAGDGSDDANALGASSTAAGASSTADGEEATSYGAGSYAGDDFSTAIGGNATAIGESSSAIGNSAATFGNYATAFGASATADDDHSLALGAFSQASAAYAVALGAGSIADRANSVSLGSTGNERQITHLAAGTADTDAVNLAQLNLAIADVDGGAGNPLAMAYDDAGKATATLAGASGTVLANVADGDVSATSTDAVNGRQLNSTNEAVAQNTGDIADNTAGIATNTTSIATNTTDIATNTSNIATNTASIDTLNTTAVFYTDATQTAVSLGDGVTPVTVGNVADGTAATDAVNKGQLDAVAAQAGATGALAVKYDDATKGRASLAGTSGTVLANVADGDVSATSKEAVNGSQLNRTNEVVSQNTSDIATNATAIGANTQAIDNINTMAVFYTDASHAAVSLGDGSTPVSLGNVADGTAATDAVNKGQLDTVAAQVGATDALAVKYDDTSKDQITLGGVSGSRISNLQASDVRTDAATAGQISDVLANIGGGAMLQAGGTISPPSFMVQGGVYGNVGDALGALDHAFNDISSRVGDIEQRTNLGNGTNAQVAVDGSGHGSDAASVVPGSKGVAVGSGAKAGGDHGTAVGGDSYAAGPNDTAIGGNARVNADGSTAVGANTTIDAVATNAVAVGEGSTVTVASGTAVGQGSAVTAAGAVALGQGSVADRANTVSVGTAASNRQITNVAAGTRATDAASLGQVQEALVTAKTYADAGDKATLNAANTYTDNKLGGMVSSTDFDTFRGQVNHQFTGVNRRLDRVGAMGTAMAQMTANTSGLAGDNRIGVGAGNYGGQSAISVGYQRAFNRNRASISVGGSASGSESTVGIGAGFSW